MKNVFNVSTYFKTQNMKRTLAQANNEHTISPFLHGLHIKHRKFSSYVFVPDIADIRDVLKSRKFGALESEVLHNDAILSLGSGVLYNKEYNWIFVLVDPSNWTLLNTAIDIAENSTNHFDAQCHIVLNATDILKDKGVKFAEAA